MLVFFKFLVNTGKHYKAIRGDKIEFPIQIKQQNDIGNVEWQAYKMPL